MLEKVLPKTTAYKDTVPSAFWLPANWPLSRYFIVGTTLKGEPGMGGGSQPPYACFNLAEHVGDDWDAVQTNRDTLKHLLDLHERPFLWLKQVHGTTVVTATPEILQGGAPEADGAFAVDSDVVLSVLTADCLPLVLADPKTLEFAVVHAGWRGLSEGIIHQVLKRFSCFQDEPSRIHVWMGPAIGRENYVVGDDVYDAFLTLNLNHAFAFHEVIRQGRGRQTRFLCDLNAVAKFEFNTWGVSKIFESTISTESDRRCYSYRRDQQKTGRMATLVAKRIIQ